MAAKRRPPPTAWALGIPHDYGPSRGLQILAEASRLVSLGRNPDGRTIKLAPGAAVAWKRMHAAAQKDGVALQPISGFRSIRRQSEIIREKLAAGETIRAILRFVAAPGYSEHHTGRAIDIGTPGEPPLVDAFERTPAFRWLNRHAGKYGFTLSFPQKNPHKIGYEPWHWCHHPLHAQAIRAPKQNQAKTRPLDS